MAISNSASGFRPGVCTSTTRPTSPFNGQVIYETDTKQTLVWQGSAWVMLTDADTPPGLQLIKEQTIGTSVASVEVTSAFSSEFDNYLITVSGGSNSSAAALQMRVGATTTNYFNSLIYTSWTNSLPTPVGNKNGTYWIYAASGLSSGLNGDIFVGNPFLSKNTYIRSTWVNTSDTGFFTGFLDNTTSYTSFSLTPNTGTITGGTIRVYGYRNTI